MELNQVYQAILENMNVEVYVRDLDKNILYINPASERLTGWSFEEASRKKCYEVFGDEELTCKEVCPVDKAISQKLHVLHHEGKLKTRSGDVKDMRVSISPFYDKENIIGAVIVMEDISRLREVEQTNVKTLIALEKEIEESKQTEMALRESEEKYKLLAEHSADVIYKLNMENEQYTYVSPSVERILGYTAKESLSLRVQDTLTTESYAIQREILQKALASGRRIPDILELEAVHKDGHTLPVEIHANFILDEQGNPVEILGVARDITDRKQAEELIVRAKQKWEQTFDVMPDLIALLDDNHRIVRVNKAMADRLGVTPDKAVGLTCYEHVHGTEAPPPFCPHTKLLADGQEHSAEIYEKRLGGDFLVTVSPFYDTEGQLFGSVHVARDISERKQAEKELIEHTLMLENILEKAADGICVCHNITEEPHVGFTHWNPRMTEITGYSMEEINKLGWYQTLYPDPDIQKQAIERMAKMREGDDIQAEEWVITTKNGEKKPLSISTSVIKEEDEKIHILAIMQDITERKKAEEALRESKERYRTLIGAIPDPLVVYDPEGRATYVNDAFERVYGWSKKELLGDHIDFVPPEEAEATQEAWRRTLQDGTVFFETKRWNKSGDLLDIQLRTAILRDQDGKHALSIVIHRDITALKQTERELQENQAKLQTLFNSVDDFLFVLNIEGYIVQVNPIVLKRLGYSETELLGEHVLKVHPPNRHMEAAAIIADMLAGKTDSCPIPLLGKDGTQIPVETKITQGRWGNQDVFFGVSRDITERIRADEELRDSESKFRSLFDLSPQAIALTEVDTGKLIDINEKFCELTKYSKKELIGRTTTEAGFYSEDDRNGFLKGLQASSEVSGLEMSFEAKDGSILQAFMFAKIIKIAYTPLILTIFLDVTEQKRLEAQLRHAHKMEAIGILAGGIAHDFNNLLTVIMGNIELAEDEIKSDVGVSEFLKHAGEASLQAKELIKQLITFSTGGAPIKKVGSIGDLVKETTNLVLSDTNVKCEFFLPHEFWYVEFDEDQMKLAVKNLIVNAVESMPDGRTIDVQAENFEIDLASAQPNSPVSAGKYVKISIRDNGIGIPKEHLSMVFDPYFSTKERGAQKGMGLGLATTYSIINRHDGHITVESEVGVGTTFTLYLPADEKDIRDLESVKAPLSEKPAIRTGRILLMDDEEMVRNLGKQALSRLGFDTELAKDGAEAIELYKRSMDLGKPYDAVILDLSVKGGMGGKDAVKKILEINPHAKTIVSSGYSNDPVMTDFREYGFIGALPKPYTIKDLIDVLNCFS